LLIEDDDGDAAYVQETLAGNGPTACLVSRSLRLTDALARLIDEQFDVVLLDLSLPGQPGLDALAQLRGHLSGTPVIVFADGGHGTTALQALDLGAEDFLIKTPAQYEVLPRVVQQVAARRRLAAELEASEYRLNLLAEQLPALLWTTDAEFRVTSWRGRRLPSAVPATYEVVGSNVRELSRTDAHARRNVEMHVRALAGESISGELYWADRWYHAHLEPLRRANGEVIGTIGVAVDVTHERKLRKGIEAAHQVQQHLLPAAAPVLPGFDIGGACFPAEDCSGDFYDFIPLSQQRLAIVLADVSGHGFGPAIMASAVRSYLRAAAVLGHHVHEMLAIANRLLVHDSPEGPFATVFAGRVDLRTGSFQFTCAGHPAYLIRAQGAVEKLETAAVPIGVVDQEVFPLSRPIPLHCGDILLLASDGLFESRGADRQGMFGLSRAVDVVQRSRELSAQEIVAKLHRAARDYAGGAPPDDDLTAVVLKRTREDAPASARHSDSMARGKPR
jgi:DNA-binding NarL/FixJ family response regulator